MRFVHISDLHLGKTFPVARYGQLAARRRQELLDTERLMEKSLSPGELAQLHSLLGRVIQILEEDREKC